MQLDSREFFEVDEAAWELPPETRVVVEPEHFKLF